MGGDHSDRLTPLVHGAEGADGDLLPGVDRWRTHRRVGAVPSLVRGQQHRLESGEWWPGAPA